MPNSFASIDFNDLAYFVQVADHGGHSATERALGIPKSRLSRRISELEKRLGVRLLQRNSRRFALTEAGHLLLKHGRAMMAEATLGMDAISQLQAVPRGTVHVSCVPNASRVLLAPVLPRFLKQYPEVRVKVQVTNRPVDLYEGGIDVALRVQPDIQESGSVVVRPLWKGTMHIVAAPSLLRDVPTPAGLEDLARFPTLDRTEPQDKHVWTLVTPDGRQVEFAHEPRLVSDDLETLLQAALAGVGIAKLSELMCGSAIAAGKLRPLLDDWTIPPHELYAIFLSRRGLLPAVRQFIDFLADSLHS